MSDPAIKARFGLDISDLKQSLRSAVAEVASSKRKMTEGFGMTEIFKNVAAPLMGMASIGGAYEALKGTLDVAGDLGTSLDNVSKQTGMAVGYLYEMNDTFEDNGVAADKLAASVAKMQKFMATSAAKGSPLLKSLGLDPKELASASPEEAFQRIGEAINEIPNASQRAAASMEIFGKAGYQLLSVFSSAQFRDGGNMQNTARLLQENAAMFKEYKDLVEDVQRKSREGFSVGFASDMMPRLMPFLKAAEENADTSSLFGQLTSAGMRGFAGTGDSGQSGIGGMAMEVFSKALEIFANQNDQTDSETPEAPASPFEQSIGALGGFGIMADSMAKIGGGGNTMGGASDPLLAEQQKQSAILMQIRDGLANRHPGSMPTANFH